jgi:hypothetical protein
MIIFILAVLLLLLLLLLLQVLLQLLVSFLFPLPCLVHFLIGLVQTLLLVLHVLLQQLRPRPAPTLCIRRDRVRAGGALLFLQEHRRAQRHRRRALGGPRGPVSGLAGQSGGDAKLRGSQ